MSHRAGYVALVGCPNVGKSSLCNVLLGEELAIVTGTPQTTRQRITGILSTDDAQLVLLDTPGYHEFARALNESMLGWVRYAVRDADACCFVVTPKGLTADDERLWDEVKDKPHLIVMNQCDRSTPDGVMRAEALLRKRFPETTIVQTSATVGSGLGALREALLAMLPDGPALFPKDDYTDRSIRFLVTELVRQAAIEGLHAEIPHACAVEIESFEEGDELTKIHAIIIVERESQKGIVIGKGGAMIKQIGIKARPAIERLVGTQVFLKLFVRVDPNWTKDFKQLKAMGLTPPSSKA
jgi:GTPase